MERYMVYGQSLRLPGELLTSLSQTIDNNTASFVKELQQLIRELRPNSGSSHSKKNIFVFKDFATTTHVFVSHDSTKRPLQQPYNGPYAVIERHDRTFVVRINGQDKAISIDRLKPAFIIAEVLTIETKDIPFIFSTNVKENQHTTRSGRRLRFPDRLQGSFQ